MAKKNKANRQRNDNDNVIEVNASSESNYESSLSSYESSSSSELSSKKRTYDYKEIKVNNCLLFLFFIFNFIYIYILFFIERSLYIDELRT